MDNVLASEPDIVYIQIGENDIGRGVGASNVDNSIAELVCMLKRPGILVIVGQLLPFTAFNRQSIVDTNTLLEQRFKGEDSVKILETHWILAFRN